MVYNLLYLTFVLMIREIVSQTLTVSCIRSGESVTLSCETTDFTNAVLFYLTGVNKGGCTGGTCLTGISGYNQPTQSGTVTEMVIAAYDHSRDGGDWTCNYGSSASGIKAAEIGNYCSGDGGSTGLTDVEKGLIASGGAVAFIIISIILCCILNKKCKFGDVCQDSPLSFIFPPGNGSKVNLTSKGSKVSLTSKGSKVSLTSKEVISNDELKNGKSSLTTSPPRSGANKPLKPVN